MNIRVHEDLEKEFLELPEMMSSVETLFEYCIVPEDLGIPRDENIIITDKLIKPGKEEFQLKIRVFEPMVNNDSLPCVLWIHGGGYITGSIDFDDGICQRFVAESNCIVVSVEYRLAPEYPYPIPLEDCYFALKWLYDNADDFNVDESRIAVAGASAGGGLTAALSLLARDRNGPPIAFQMPLYPMIDNSCNKPESKEIVDNRIWNDRINKEAWNAYLGHLKDPEITGYAVVAKNNDYRGLPPTYTCVGDLDPFYGETIEYVMNLKEAGVPVEFHLYPGCFHGFENIIPDAQVSLDAKNQYFKAMKYALNKEK
jgi:acetyl esterase/lipase